MNEILHPMLASLADAPLADPQLVYEPKYHGIRAIVEIDTAGRVRLWSRLGNEKTHQFPEVAAALDTWARARKPPRELVLDGEIVALDSRGEPTGFQQLQGRIHVAKRGRESFSTVAREKDSRPLFPGRPSPSLRSTSCAKDAQTFASARYSIGAPSSSACFP